MCWNSCLGLCTTTSRSVRRGNVFTRCVLFVCHILQLASRDKSPDRSISVPPKTQIGPLSSTYISQGEAHELNPETDSCRRRTRSKYLHKIPSYRRLRRRFFRGSVPHSFPQCGGSVINQQRRQRLASRYLHFVPETQDSVSGRFSSVRSRLEPVCVASTAFVCRIVPIGTTAGERERRGPVPIGTPEEFPSRTDSTDTIDRLRLQIRAHNKRCPCPSCLDKILSTQSSFVGAC